MARRGYTDRKLVAFLLIVWIHAFITFHPKQQPLHSKQSLNLAYLEIGTYDQMVAHLKRKLEHSGLENDGEPTIPTMTAVPPNDNQQNTEQSMPLL